MENTCVCKKFSDEKKKEFQKTVEKALKILNKKNFSLIIHGASFPSLEDQDTGFGSYNSEGGKKFIEFAHSLGFNGIQLGPDGKTKAVDSSPYVSTMFSNNPLFIDLYKLTTEEYGKILDADIFKKIVSENPAQNNRTAYGYAYEHYNKALRVAFRTYGEKLAQKDKSAQKLEKEYNKFVKENAFWLDKDAIYEALSIKHGNDYWPMWKDELDKKLFCPNEEFTREQTEERLAEIQSVYTEEINFYKFVQLLAYLQKLATKEYTLKKGIKTIADAQVAFSDRDFWANQMYFMKDYFLGCPPDCFSEDGQAWGFPVMNPDGMFNPDGSLGEGGKVLKARFKKMFEENPGGVRIDHIIGLIDPYVYKKGCMPKPDQGASRLYSSPEHGELGKFAIAKEENLNPEFGPENEKRIMSLSDEQIKKYAEIIEKIVIKAASELKINKESIICEDLGTVTMPVLEVMEKTELSGLRVTQFVDPNIETHAYRIKSTEPRHWVMVGSHDNTPMVCWANELYDKHQVYPYARNLARDLKPEQEDQFCHELLENKSKFITAKYAELFASPAENIQVFFADLFGMCERYNMPGTSGDVNWSLRVPSNYECFYYCQLAKGEAFNIAEVLILAIESKGEDFVLKNKDLLDKLQYYADFLMKK